MDTVLQQFDESLSKGVLSQHDYDVLKATRLAQLARMLFLFYRLCHSGSLEHNKIVSMSGHVSDRKTVF